jgi:hypothetical protein
MMTSSHHVYEVRPRKDRRGVDLISDALPFGRLCYAKPDDAVEYAEVFSRLHDAVIRVYNDAGKGGRPPLVAPNIERRAIPVPDAHSCVLGAPF